ncbi:MAG: ATP-dependent RecD-like DNA helicase [Ruminococcus sp.]|jgi:exodeoxyribonuclease V alpha subunit|nr:ATP-dependent RecD-like DNA helicase [Ruminococcus sp.]
MRRVLKNPETIEGTVDSITYQNEENGFIVMVIDFGGDPITVTGELGNVGEGEQVKLFGEFSVHMKYGHQFYAVSCERKLPVGESAMFKYLSSGAIKGVGKKTAKLIVDNFGDKAFDILENHPEELAKVNGISKKKANDITEEFRRIYGIRELSLFLAEYDISPAMSASVWKLWGHFAKDMIVDNPFILCSGDIGLSFKNADKIASALGKEQDNLNRVCAGAEYILETAGFSGGHTALPSDIFYSECRRLLGVETEVIEKAVIKSEESKNVVIIKDRISLYKYYRAEMNIASYLKKATKSVKEFDFNALIEVEEAGKGIKYAELQKQAIGSALTTGITVLTGGPGTGKTTTLNAIISLYKQRGSKVMIAAPTGKAAKRISELTGFAAKTIHRLLEVSYDVGNKLSFVHDESNKLDCDVLVIDEMSMVDSELFTALLAALKDDCRLVLVGDSDQLPSVGAGNVLHDIISSGIVRVVTLNEIFRQARESGIVTNAHKIVHGEYPDLKASDFFFMQRLDAESCVETVLELLITRLPTSYSLSPIADIQVLSPVRKGPVGIENMNKRIQELINPESPMTTSIRSGIYTFRINDKVMQTVNNYDIVWTLGTENGTGIFNGEIGIIRSVSKEDDSVVIDFDGKLAEYTVDMLRDLELAYAITVHKSQGSEFNAVILPLLGGYDRLYCRNLLYTAVTRAKKLLVIVGSRNVVCKMVDNNLQTERFTLLEDFLLEN